MTPKVLAAGIAGDWFDCRPFAGRDLPVKVVVAGGAGAVLESSYDEGQVKAADVSTVEAYAATTEHAIAAPLPSFLRIRNTGGGNVTFAFGMGVNARGEPCQVFPQTFDTPRSGAFSV